MNSQLSKYQQESRCTRTALWAFFLLGLALPVSPVLVNLSFVVLIACILIDYKVLPIRAMLREPGIWVPLGLYALLAFSLLWTQGGNPLDYLTKYRKLLLVVPFTLAFLIYSKAFVRISQGFLMGVGLSVLASFYVFISGDLIGHSQVGNATVLKKEITHNFFVAVAVIGLLFLAYEKTWNKSGWFLVAAAVMVFNLYVMVDGRTGQIALIPAVTVFFVFLFLYRPARLIATSVAGVAVLGIGTCVLLAQASYVQGLEELKQCYNAWGQVQSTQEVCASSMGARTTFWLTVIETVRVHPWGIGIGGFPEKVLGFYYNPHSDYLLYALQLGWLGLVIYLIWYVRAARIVWQESRLRPLLMSLLVLYMVANLFNSFTLDFSEGGLFIVLMAFITSLGITDRSRRRSG